MTPFPAQLRVHGRPIRLDPPRVRPALRAGIQEALQRRIIELWRQRPSERRGLRPVQQAADGGQAHASALRDLAHSQPVLPVQSENVANLAHRKSLPRHGRCAPFALWSGSGHWAPPRRTPPAAVRDLVKWVFTFG